MDKPATNARQALTSKHPRAWRRVGWLTGLALATLSPLHAATMDPAVLPQVQAATFEVVIPKPGKDPLTYEKPLPLDQLPYQERTDKYYSVGTAFAIGENRYVTAGHVIAIGIDSLMGEPALRDASGHVYAIDKITRYSLHEDFVEFTLKDPPKVAPLAVNTQPEMNEVVYAVGNALGTGIVIRDGLYTSQTPEEQDGRWKWLRFSAAASPGNSGGPLLDKDGKVVGVVVMKSPDENLNYALPIDLVLKAPANLGEIDTRESYQLDVIEEKHTGAFKAQFPLPKSFADFSATYQKLHNADVDQKLHDLLTENAATLFPNGAGSSRLLHSNSNLNAFPTLLHRNSNGDWTIATANESKAVLPRNGYLSRAVVGQQMMFHLRKPDDVTSKQLYADSKLFMDLALKAAPLQRRVGAEQVKITSLGKPSLERDYTDAYQRRWQIREWPMAYNNGLLIAFLLPVPDGYAAVVRITNNRTEHEDMADLTQLANFVYLSYSGTLAQWKEFLANTDLLPSVLSDIAIRFNYGDDFKYQSKRIGFAYTPSLQKIDADSQLVLGMSYFQDRGKTIWDVSKVEVRSNVENAERVTVGRHVAPSDDLDDSFRNHWGKIVNRSHPDDGVPYSENDMTYIGAVGGTQASADIKPEVLYTAFYGVDGPRPEEAMKGKLNLLLEKLQVNEH
ncbi:MULTISPECIES: serine protease [unclassified Dyella]|uniref:S1 family peptidase n=1 Tax=unclassified Dyella TaxID=2634549 RepID=UPI000C818D7F|nr:MULTISPECIES: serine protease [unclassified Dyella]MDR3445664.1 serine protease [Dyella sp.]PMQ04007.1 putative serine protease HhoA [Dyella sp. AD56]